MPWSLPVFGIVRWRSWPRSWGSRESCLRDWLAQADRDEGTREGLSSQERKELAALRREKRRLGAENEILRRAAACFARANVLPK